LPDIFCLFVTDRAVGVRLHGLIYKFILSQEDKNEEMPKILKTFNIFHCVSFPKQGKAE